jgi:hypothetical protein
MGRLLKAMLLSAAFCAAGIVSAFAADDAEKWQIAGGIEGKVKNVDVVKKTLTIVTKQGRERTLNITEETVLVGPRGGKVRRHLKDPRFHEGFPVIVVMEGEKTSQVHLGFARQAAESKGTDTAATTKDSDSDTKTGSCVRRFRVNKITPDVPPTDTPSTSDAKTKSAKTAEDEDEDEIPGQIKSFNATSRILVVTLLNGKDRSFFLAKNVPIHVRNTTSRLGLQDPSLKAGASVNVITEEGGRKVKEVRIIQHRAKKAA